MTKEKLCSKCGEQKPLDQFDPDPRMTLGRRSSCRECRKQWYREYRKRKPEMHRDQERRRRDRNREHINALQRVSGKRYYYRHREKVRERMRQRHTGAPPGTYVLLLAAQRGVCAICGRAPNGRAHHIDHSHSTGKIRGVLCMNCNQGLGHFKDDPTLLGQAIAYLLQYAG